MYLLHMAALYWWEAYTVHKGTLEAAVAANPLAGYGIILLGTCAAGLAVAVAHNLFHSKLQTLFGGKKTKEKVAKA